MSNAEAYKYQGRGRYGITPRPTPSDAEVEEAIKNALGINNQEADISNNTTKVVTSESENSAGTFKLGLTPQEAREQRLDRMVKITHKYGTPKRPAANRGFLFDKDILELKDKRQQTSTVSNPNQVQTPFLRKSNF